MTRRRMPLWPLALVAAVVLGGSSPAPASPPWGYCNSDEMCADAHACTTDRCDLETHTCYYINHHELCDDGVDCTEDQCTGTIAGCISMPVHDRCDDGLWCNGTEYCRYDGCQPGTPVDCDDQDPCTLDQCHEGLQRCLYACGASGPADPCCDDPACAGTPPCEESCADGDGDGYGAPASQACPHAELDCDDGAPNVNPGADEDCENRIDDDCDDQVDKEDPDCGGAAPWQASASADASEGVTRGRGDSGVWNLLTTVGFSLGLVALLRRRSTSRRVARDP